MLELLLQGAQETMDAQAPAAADTTGSNELPAALRPQVLSTGPSADLATADLTAVSQKTDASVAPEAPVDELVAPETLIPEAPAFTLLASEPAASKMSAVEDSEPTSLEDGTPADEPLANWTALLSSMLPAAAPAPAEHTAAAASASTAPASLAAATPATAIAASIVQTAVACARTAASKSTTRTETETIDTASVRLPEVGAGVDAKLAAPVADTTLESSQSELAFAVRLTEQPSPENAAAAPAEAAPAVATTSTAPKSREAKVELAATATAASQGAGQESATTGESSRPAETFVPAATVASTRTETAAPAAKTGASTSATTATAAHPANEAQPAEARGEVREISIRIVDDRARTAAVRVSERGGEVHVAVRTADPAVAGSLRSDLTELAARIEKRDVSAEIWRPETRIEMRAASASSDSARQGDAGSSSSAFEQSGQGSGQSRGQNSGRGNQPAPEWLDEFDAQPKRQNKRLTR